MKVPCEFCGKKFHRKGIFVHRAKCKKRIVDPNPPLQAETVNTMNVHPRVRVKESVEAFWNMLSLSEKLVAISMFEERSNPY